MSTSPEDERLLDALFQDAREEPQPQDLRRVEDRLRPWLVPSGESISPAKPSFPRARALRVLLAVVGFGLLSQYFRDASPPRGVDAPRGIASGAVTSDRAPPASLPVASVSVDELPSVPANPSAPIPGAAPRPVHAAHVVTAPTPATARAVEEPAASQSESEASFLRRTRAALAGDPALALRMTEEHASRYPRGVLVQECDVIAIDALVRLEAHDEARAKARAFRARYPSSAHASRIAAILGKEEQ